MNVSVVIPTYNRATTVMHAIRSAAAVDYPSDGYEIIVVDNASTDATPQVVKNLQGHVNGRTLRYVLEKQLGLHNARHAGANAATGEILVFTDDDATFDPGWLQAYATAFAEHPEMAAAAGPVRPVWEAPPPQWLIDFMGDSKSFGILSLMEPYKEFRLDRKGMFFGVNMAIRRDVLFEVGGFNPEAFGDIWLGDGETGLNRKLWNRGMLIGHVPDAVVYHHIPAQRMTVDYFCCRMANEGACAMYSRFHRGVPHWFNLCLYGAAMAIKNSKYLVAGLLANGRTDSRSLRMRLQASRTKSQLRYVLRLMVDNDLRKLVLKEDWLSE
jgi:glycosyltransferase involved in cell wall biosynthesis